MVTFHKFQSYMDLLFSCYSFFYYVNVFMINALLVTKMSGCFSRNIKSRSWVGSYKVCLLTCILLETMEAFLFSKSSHDTTFNYIT